MNTLVNLRSLVYNIYILYSPIEMVGKKEEKYVKSYQFQTIR